MLARDVRVAVTERAGPRVPGWSLTAAGAVGTTLLGSAPTFLIGGLETFALPALGASRQLLGIAVAAFFAASAVSSYLGGRLSDRLLPRHGMIMAAALSVIAALSIATWVRSGGTLIVALSLAGASNGLGHPASNSAIAANVPQRRRALALGMKQAAIPMTSVLAGLSVPVFALTVGWRWSFVAAAVLGAGLVALTPPASRPRPRTTQTGAGRRSFDLRRLLLIALCGMLGSAGATALGSFLVESLTHSGFSPTAAGVLLAAGNLAGVTIRIILGWSADRHGLSPFPLMAGLLATAVISYLLLGFAGSAIVLGAAAVFAAFGGNGWQGLFQYSVVLHAGDSPAVATGIAQSGVYIGAMAGPVTFGFVSTGPGFGAAWSVVAITSLAASALLVGITLQERRARVPEPPRQVVPESLAQ